MPIDDDLRDGATIAGPMAAQRSLLAISVPGVWVVASRCRDAPCLAAAEAIVAHAGAGTPIDPQ